MLGPSRVFLHRHARFSSREQHGKMDKVGTKNLSTLKGRFSAGARFTTPFVKHYSDRMLTECACGVGQRLFPV